MKTEDFNEFDVIGVRYKFGRHGLPSVSTAPLIRLFTGCKYNHAAVVAKLNGRLSIFEAVAGGFEPTCYLEHFLSRVGKDYEIIVLRNPQVDHQQARQRLADSLYLKYDFEDTFFHGAVFRIRVALYKLGLLDRLQWNGQTENAYKLVNCSEIAAYIHNLPHYYLYATRELIDNPVFQILYQSKPLETRHTNNPVLFID